jgi:carbon starvation protein CstA
MTARVVTLSALFGVVWHTIVVLLLGRDIKAAVSAAMIAGAIAGVCAGFLTVRSRERHHGRESVLDAVLAYYLAVVVYAVSLVWIGWLTGAGSQGEEIGVLSAFGLSWVMPWYAVIFATLPAGIVLLPLSFLTRFLLWRLSGRMRSNKA